MDVSGGIMMDSKIKQAVEESADKERINNIVCLTGNKKKAYIMGASEVINNPSKYGLKPINEWVSVKERLPEDTEEVLLYTGTDIVQGYYRDGYWRGSCIVTDNMNDVYVNDRVICKQGSHFDFVTHWQPLPQPPINEREEG
jgi:hypothetical protein